MNTGTTAGGIRARQVACSGGHTNLAYAYYKANPPERLLELQFRHGGRRLKYMFLQNEPKFPNKNGICGPRAASCCNAPLRYVFDRLKSPALHIEVTKKDRRS
jgi:hypothetical protein